jgi:hypothetical protein
MMKIVAGILVALMSAGLLLLGCTTTGLGTIGTTSDSAAGSSASPSTSGGAGPEPDSYLDLSEFPQAL